MLKPARVVTAPLEIKPWNLERALGITLASFCQFEKLCRLYKPTSLQVYDNGTPFCSVFHTVRIAVLCLCVLNARRRWFDLFVLLRISDPLGGIIGRYPTEFGYSENEYLAMEIIREVELLVHSP